MVIATAAAAALFVACMVLRLGFGISVLLPAVLLAATGVVVLVRGSARR